MPDATSKRIVTQAAVVEYDEETGDPVGVTPAQAIHVPQCRGVGMRGSAEDLAALGLTPPGDDPILVSCPGCSRPGQPVRFWTSDGVVPLHWA